MQPERAQRACPLTSPATGGILPHKSALQRTSMGEIGAARRPGVGIPSRMPSELALFLAPPLHPRSVPFVDESHAFRPILYPLPRLVAHNVFADRDGSGRRSEDSVSR